MEIGLGFCGFVPKLISSNFSSAITCMSFSAATSLSLSVSLSSFEFSWATQHTKLLCCDPRLGPLCLLQVGPMHLHNKKTILQSGVQILTHRGVSLNSKVGAFFLFVLRINGSLKSGSMSSWTSSHLRMKVPYGLDIELSPYGAHSS